LSFFYLFCCSSISLFLFNLFVFLLSFFLISLSSHLTLISVSSISFLSSHSFLCFSFYLFPLISLLSLFSFISFLSSHSYLFVFFYYDFLSTLNSVCWLKKYSYRCLDTKLSIFIFYLLSVTAHKFFNLIIYSFCLSLQPALCFFFDGFSFAKFHLIFTGLVKSFCFFNNLSFFLADLF
jgi:hypothetical protein